jgi:drug/metabolite transporter (DMT)-like permease
MTDPTPDSRAAGPAFGSSDALMIAAVVMWGINFSTIKIALRELTPGGFNGMRLFITAALFVVLVALSREKFRIERRDILGLAAVGIAGNAIYQILFIHGVSLTTASNTSLILSISPVFVALLGAVLGIERIHWAAWLGILISFSGLYLVIAGGNGGLRFSAANVTGDLFIFGAAVFWASYTVFSKPFLERMSPLKFSAYTVWAGAIVYLPLTARDVLAVSWIRVSFRSWVMIVLSSLFGFVIGYLIWYNSVKKVGNSKTAIYNNLTPVFTALFAALILGESFRARQLIGAAVILTGVYLTRSGYRFFVRRSQVSS